MKVMQGNFSMALTVHFNNDNGPAVLTSPHGELIQKEGGADNRLNVIFPGMDSKGGRYFVYVDGKNEQICLHGMDAVSSLAYRFHLARQGGGHVDLRFCTGEEKFRNPEHDNARPDYRRFPDAPRTFNAFG